MRMPPNYSKTILIVTIVIVVLGAVLIWWLVRKEPAPQPSTSAEELSEEDKLQMLRDLAASSKASADISIEKKEQILQKAHSSSAAQSFDQTDTSTNASERQMEILRSLRYSE